jgi:hypothetical protein
LGWDCSCGFSRCCRQAAADDRERGAAFPVRAVVRRSLAGSPGAQEVVGVVSHAPIRLLPVRAGAHDRVIRGPGCSVSSSSPAGPAHAVTRARPGLDRRSHGAYRRPCTKPKAWLPQWLPSEVAETRMLPLTCCSWVELRGFEPLTPSMRTRCATGLRYSPENLA